MRRLFSLLEVLNHAWRYQPRPKHVFIHSGQSIKEDGVIQSQYLFPLVFKFAGVATGEIDEL